MAPDNSSLTQTLATEDSINAALISITFFVVNLCLNPALSFFGVITNIINVLVFRRSGGNDGVTATFIVLSASDGVFSLLGVTIGVCYMVLHRGPPSITRTAFTVRQLLLPVAAVPNFASMYATVVIAVVRCCSVAMPLRVRSVLTGRRQLITIASLTLVFAATLSYVISSYRFTSAFDPATNTTQLIMTVSRDYPRRYQILEVYRNVTFITSFAIVNICLVILVVALKRSSKFRSVASTAASGVGPTPANVPSVKVTTFSRRETQVIKTVVLVTVVFVVLNLPGLALAIVRQTLPGLHAFGYFRRSYELFLSLAGTLFLGVVPIPVDAQLPPTIELTHAVGEKVRSLLPAPKPNIGLHIFISFVVVAFKIFLQLGEQEEITWGKVWTTRRVW